MTTSQQARPNFFEGQYIGAEDLDLAVDYNRFLHARHTLGAHAWGIGRGLELAEVDSATGVDVSIQPGFAMDGYGRQVVVDEAYSIPLDYFSSITPSPGVGSSVVRVKVWIKFRGDETSSPANGFAVCDADDQFARLDEGFDVEVARDGDYDHDGLHDPITVAGVDVDALEAPPSRAATDPVLCDESVPYQTFPTTEEDPDRRWLIPLGFVCWDAAAAQLVASSEADRRLSRSCRRYVGTVTEEILAADGLIRMKRRATDPPAEGSTDSLSSVCEAQLLRVGDDEDMTYADDAVGIIDLVWIEGNLRIIGDAKLFDGKLDFRDAEGGTNGVSLVMQRDEDNGIGGKDLEVGIGEGTDGENRFVVGPLIPDPADPAALVVDEKFAVLDSGNVGIGAGQPECPLQIGDATNPVMLCLRGPDGEAESSQIAFEENDGSTADWFRITHDTSANTLSFKSDDVDPILAMTRSDGHVGIGLADPAAPLHVVGGSDVDLGNGSGTVVIGQEAEQNLALDGNEIMAREDGSPSTLHFQAQGGDLRVHTHMASTSEFIIKDSGNVGLGLTNPLEKLHVNGSVRGNQSGALRIQTDTGWTDVGSKNSSWSHFYTDRDRYYFDTEIRVDSGRIGSYDEDLELRTSGVTRITIDENTGNVGIATSSPNRTLDIDGRIGLNGGDFSFDNSANHGGMVNAPAGTSTSDWNILVAPRFVGEEEAGSESDNALIAIDCRATTASVSQWEITARYKYRFSNNSNGQWRSGTANYIIVPR